MGGRGEPELTRGGHVPLLGHQVQHQAPVHIDKKNQTEEKAKVVAAVWGTYFNGAQAI